MTTTELLAGRRILIVEDEFFIADDLAAAFTLAGALVVGPVGSLGEALELAARSGSLDGAVLDVNLQGEVVYPLVDRLVERGVPVVFATGQLQGTIPERYARIPVCPKPVDLVRCARALLGVAR